MESTLSVSTSTQDGSCNGLQHYAALGRDSFGAEQVNLTYLVFRYMCLISKQVNLTLQDVPADLYSTVAKMVRYFSINDYLVP